MLFDKFSREFENYFRFILLKKRELNFSASMLNFSATGLLQQHLNLLPRGVYANDYYFQLLYRPVTKEIVQLLQGQQFAFGNQVFSTTSFIRLITAIVEDCLGTGSTGSVGVVLSSFTGRISVKIPHFRIFLVAHNVNYSSM